MKFIDLINQRLQHIAEQVPGEMPGVLPVDPSQIPPAPAGLPPAPVETQPPADTLKPLSPEGEVFLVRLLKKALFMNPGDLDEKMLTDLPEINETNAADVLTQIVNVMKKYSTEIDVET